MSFRIFAEVEFLAAITTFELFSSFFHSTHLSGHFSPPSRNRCAIHVARADRVSRRSMYHFRESNPPEVLHIQTYRIPAQDRDGTLPSAQLRLTASTK
jgi:hypothetical protein